jgi:hypothetical protein
MLPPIHKLGGEVMSKRDTDLQAPVCPNNTRHGLRPDSRGGYVCETCVEDLAGTRSRLPTRWAFATRPAAVVDSETQID